jgi:hypothetical protein
VLRAAARCPGPKCLADTLEHSKFGHIGALVLARNLGKLRIETEEDTFPEPTPIAIDFRPKLFGPGYWIKRRFGGYEVLVHR